PDGKIVVLVNVGRECGALDVGVDLVGDRDKAVADYFERYRIDGESLWARAVGGFLHHDFSLALPDHAHTICGFRRASRSRTGRPARSAWSIRIPRSRPDRSP